MKEIEVVAAIIQEDGKIFATQRGYGDLKGGWEFPGGKLEKGNHLSMPLFAKFKKSSIQQLKLAN